MISVCRTSVLLAVCLAALFSCGRMPERPPNVPGEAVKIIAAKGTGPWQWCELRHDGEVHCRFYNNRGETLCDDTFVVYSGREPKSDGDLKISPDGGEQWVRLQNGTLLIPESQRAEMTRFLDWLFGKRATR
jgi:hypothetical protein